MWTNISIIKVKDFWEAHYRMVWHPDQQGKVTLMDKLTSYPSIDTPTVYNGGFKGFDMVVWDVAAARKTTIYTMYLSKDGEEGYPGNLQVSICSYSLRIKMNLLSLMQAQTDKELGPH